MWTASLIFELSSDTRVVNSAEDYHYPRHVVLHIWKRTLGAQLVPTGYIFVGRPKSVISHQQTDFSCCVRRRQGWRVSSVSYSCSSPSKVRMVTSSTTEVYSYMRTERCQWEWSYFRPKFVLARKIPEGHLLEKKQLQCMFWIPKSEKTFPDFRSQLWTLHACAACLACEVFNLLLSRKENRVDGTITGITVIRLFSYVSMIILRDNVKNIPTSLPYSSKY